MSANGQAPTTKSASREFASAAGVLFLVTHVTSVAAPFLYGPMLNDARYVVSPGSHSQVLLGALFEVILALAIIGTAVALFPVVKRQNEGIALGYVGLRTLEAGIIAIGVVPLLAVETLRQHGIGTTSTDLSTLLAVGNGLVALHNWTVVIGPGLVCGANTVLLAYLMSRSGLVPRFIPVLGLIGGPLVFTYNTAILFGLGPEIPAWAGVLVVPVFTWEVSLAIWLIAKDFTLHAVAAQSAGPTTN